MNWLLIIAVLVLAGNMVWGFYRGLIRVVYSVVAWILILVFVTWATPYMSDALTEHTGLDERIEAGCQEKLHELVKGENAKDNEADDSGKDGSEDGISGLGMQLPQVVMDKLFDANRTADWFLEESGAYSELSERATGLAMRGISFVLVFVIAMLAFHIAAVVLDLVAKLPVIGEVNHFLGGVAGFLKGILLIWLVFAFVAMGSATSVGMGLISFIYDSELLVWFYEHNLVLTILMIFL